jgi:hypothetical protein
MCGLRFTLSDVSTTTKTWPPTCANGIASAVRTPSCPRRRVPRRQVTCPAPGGIGAHLPRQARAHAVVDVERRQVSLDERRRPQRRVAHHPNAEREVVRARDRAWRVGARMERRYRTARSARRHGAQPCEGCAPCAHVGPASERMVGARACEAACEAVCVRTGAAGRRLYAGYARAVRRVGLYARGRLCCMRGCRRMGWWDRRGAAPGPHGPHDGLTPLGHPAVARDHPAEAEPHVVAAPACAAACCRCVRRRPPSMAARVGDARMGGRLAARGLYFAVSSAHARTHARRGAARVGCVGWALGWIGDAEGGGKGRRIGASRTHSLSTRVPPLRTSSACACSPHRARRRASAARARFRARARSLRGCERVQNQRRGGSGRARARAARVHVCAHAHARTCVAQGRTWRSMQHAADNIHYTTCNVQHATYAMQQTPCNMHCTPYTMHAPQPAVCVVHGHLPGGARDAAAAVERPPHHQPPTASPPAGARRARVRGAFGMIAWECARACCV